MWKKNNLTPFIQLIYFSFTDGYGKVAFESLFSLKLPLTLGRDFAGLVRAVGKEVKDIKVGDEVMGVVPPQSGTGSHAQFVVVTASCIVLKPSNLSMIEAASIPYAGLTAWSGLTSMLSGHLSDKTNRGIKVLVMGASGGVGSIAIQLCKLWGCVVNSFFLSYSWFFGVLLNSYNVCIHDTTICRLLQHALQMPFQLLNLWDRITLLTTSHLMLLLV